MGGCGSYSQGGGGGVGGSFWGGGSGDAGAYAVDPSVAGAYGGYGGWVTPKPKVPPKAAPKESSPTKSSTAEEK